MNLPALEATIGLVARWHITQVDKQGKEYILHLLRVMLRLQGDNADMTVALLHDCVEDCDVTAGVLGIFGYPQEIIDDVFTLSRREGERYFSYIQRIKDEGSPRAIRVKLADLADNSDITRAYKPPKEMASLYARYETARSILLSDSKKEVENDIQGL